MAIALFADQNVLLEQVEPIFAAAIQNEMDLCVLLTDGESKLASPLQTVLETLIQVDVTSPRLNRLNFDAVALALLDLSPRALLSSGGRRLTDALGRLAEESLVLGFVGVATGVTGAFLADGETAGLNLIPRTVVIPDVRAVADLRTLLERTSAADLRLLALDGSVSAIYDYASDNVIVQGEGSVLLAAYQTTQGDPQPTARLQVVAPGNQSDWPA
jgi:hypothetical protein